VRLWIDTDIGDNPDDAVALLAAAAHPGVDLVGVSTTGGRTDWRAELARELVPIGDQIPVVAGERAGELLQAIRSAALDRVLGLLG
jgi:inosine-uridine nucleoside N-ribohydrolase